MAVHHIDGFRLINSPYVSRNYDIFHMISVILILILAAMTHPYILQEP